MITSQKSHSIQEKIFKLINEKAQEISNNIKVGDWKKFRGDYFVRVIKARISEEIPDSFKVTEPGAYISGIPIEYDLLIVDKNAKPQIFTNSFEANEVHLGLELKVHGIFGGRDDLQRSITKIKNNFDIARKYHSHINFIYMTFKEVTNPVRKKSIDYLAETVKYLSPYKVFCLSDSRRKILIDGQWQKFIQEINKSLGS
jgi:hypothetical protein